MSLKKRIILRADANTQIGTGHVFRLLALAEMLSPTFEVLFCTQTNNQQILDTISSQVDKLIKLPGQFEYCLPSVKELNAEIAFDLKDIIKENDIVVTDGYWFRENYQLSIKKLGAKLLMIDDFANQYFYADAVINHAPGLSVDLYQGEPYTRYYLGLSYALIRKAFFEQPRQDGLISANAVFIAFGGSDPCGLSVKYTEYLLKHTAHRVHLLYSKLFQQNILQQINLLKKQFAKRLSISNNLQAKELILVLDNCHYAIVPSSTILFECLARRLKCITGHYTENQVMAYSGFIHEKYCVGLGDFRIHEQHTLPMFFQKADDVSNEFSVINSSKNIFDMIDNLCKS